MNDDELLSFLASANYAAIYNVAAYVGPGESAWRAALLAMDKEHKVLLVAKCERWIQKYNHQYVKKKARRKHKLKLVS